MAFYVKYGKLTTDIFLRTLIAQGSFFAQLKCELGFYGMLRAPGAIGTLSDDRSFAMQKEANQMGDHQSEWHEIE